MHSDTNQGSAATGQHRPAPPPVPKSTESRPGAVKERSPWYEDLLESLGSRLLGLPVQRLDTLAMTLLIVIADGCLYDAPGGVGSACLLIACAIGLAALPGRRPAGTTLTLAGVVVLTAVMMVWDHWWLLGIMGWASLTVLAIKVRRPDWKSLESLWAAGWTMALAPIKALGHPVAGAVRRTAAARKRSATDRKRMPIRVVLVPVGICVLFIFIFSAANPVVAQLTESVREAIRLFFEYFWDVVTIGRIFFWLGCMVVFAGLIRPAARSKLADFLGRFDETLETPKEKESNDTNYTTALGTLISVNILFLAYNCMDANYLYLKAALPEGIIWADYTHAGCGWLTFGLFISAVVIGVTFWRRLNFHPKAHRIKFLCYIWAVQNAVLAVGAIRRLQMYIDYSGLTHLRITGIYGSLLVAAGLAIMVRKVRANRSFIWLVRNYIRAFCVALLLLALTPSNWLCASYNARKVVAGKPRALRPICLKDLAPGALPPLIPLLNYSTDDGDPDKDELVRQGIAGILGRHLTELEKAEPRAWTEKQLSATWALKHLRAVRDDIHEIVPQTQWQAAEERLVSNYDLTEPARPFRWSGSREYGPRTRRL